MNEPILPSEMAQTKQPTTVGVEKLPEDMTFEDLKACVDSYFSSKDYIVNKAYEKGYASVVSEDYTKIDLACNVTDIIYNLCSSDPDMSPEEKQNFKNLCNGITLLNKSLKQYDRRTTSEFVAVLTGYILKLVRNNLHD